VRTWYFFGVSYPVVTILLGVTFPLGKILLREGVGIVNFRIAREPPAIGNKRP